MRIQKKDPPLRGWFRTSSYLRGFFQLLYAAQNVPPRPPKLPSRLSDRDPKSSLHFAESQISGFEGSIVPGSMGGCAAGDFRSRTVRVQCHADINRSRRFRSRHVLLCFPGLAGRWRHFPGICTGRRGFLRSSDQDSCLERLLRSRSTSFFEELRGLALRRIQTLSSAAGRSARIRQVVHRCKSAEADISVRPHSH
jgi:hypothetical protein